MSAQKIAELTKDLAELETLVGQTQRPRNIDALSLQKKRVQTEITTLREQLAKVAPAKGVAAPAAKPAEPKRYECEITSYAWDQSDKFVKFFISLDGITPDDDAKVTVTFEPTAILLKISDVHNKDHRFGVKHLLHELNVEKSYRKVKSNSIAIYAKKSTEGEKWSHLTSTEKRLADLKGTASGKMDLGDKDDPSAGLMNIMKSMYESGDSDTKRMIAKAWTEGQQKQQQGGGPGLF